MYKESIVNFKNKYLSPKLPLRKHCTEAPVDSHGMILYVEGVNKSFDGFKAINDLNL